MDSPRFPSKSSNAPGPPRACRERPRGRAHQAPGPRPRRPYLLDFPALGLGVLALLGPALGGLGGCGDEAPLTDLSYRLVGPPPLRTETGCAVDEPAPGIDTSTGASDEAPADIRLTYRATGTGALVCDVVLPAGGGDAPRPVVAVPRGGPVDITVEVFGDRPDATTPPPLLARGQASDVDLAASAGVDIRVRPVSAFSCAADKTGTPRAFHAATPLPGGRVLLTGGVTGSPGDDGGTAGRAVDLDGAGLFVTSAVEIYDPASETFTAVSVPGLIPRAMHEAHVVGADADGRVRIALVGGITASGDPGALPALVAGTGGLRLEPGPGAAAAPLEMLAYDPATGDIVRERLADEPAPRLLAASAWASLESGESGESVGRLMVAGGAEAGALAPLSDVDVLDLDDPAASATTTTSAGRLGATATDLGDGRVLIWGGHLAEAIENRTTHAGELLSDIASAGPSAAPPLFLGSAAPAARAFHTAVRAGDDSVLVVGGFDITDSGVAVNPAAVLAERLVPVTSAEVEVSSVALVGGGTPEPGAFVAAVALGEGDVLVSGGNPTVGYGDCATSGQGLVCALDTAYRYSAESASFAVTQGPLLLGRYGHQMTALPDGTVLVTGGLHAGGAAGNDLQVLTDAELYAAPAPAGTDDLGRAPGQVAPSDPDDPDSAPLAPCALIETPAMTE